jgi:cytochrome c553
MGHRPRFLALLGIAVLITAPRPVSGEASPRQDAAVEFFEKKIRPVLVGNCYTCHSADTNSKGGLRVDDRNGLLQGGNGGPAVVPGKPEESLLLLAVRHEEGAPRMPPKRRLSADQIADVTKWIEDGAAWPTVAGAAAVGVGKPNVKYEELRKNHWAWQPLHPGLVPAVQDRTWPVDGIDRYILARLEKEGLKPVGDADRRALIRRVTFDLTGLPPTPEEVEAFLADSSAGAFERVVDRLLASPAYGERWGRHWLDVARYGESTGSSRNLPFPHVWRYRDYVIDAFDRDKPFDQFIREQIAGDLLPAASEAERTEHLIATGFLALGVKDVNQRFKVRFIMDNVDEQIDAVSRGVLGLTASCARCHDHKFDPIPTADYYALAGIFTSTDLCAGLRNKMGGGGLDYYDTDMMIPLGPKVSPDPAGAAKIEKARKAVAEAKAELDRLIDNPEGDKRGADGRPKRAIARQAFNRRRLELLALTDPAANGGKVSLGVRDAKVVADTEVRIRGEAEKLGPTVHRGFLGVLPLPGQPAVNPRQSGRLELAHWLTSEENPLTPRVMVNRIWRHLFDQGLVTTVDNFGVMGDKPSHPGLLDYLAEEFVDHGWSVKALVRKVVLSRTYRLSSDAAERNLARDPANRLVWRHRPRRLDAEEIRDATLVVAGELAQERPVASPARDLKVVELPNNGPLARRLQAAAAASRHRSVYLPLLRGITPRSLEVFDFAEQGMVTGSRDTTTVALQALYLLNDPFVRRQALNLASRLLRRTDLGDAGRVDLAYRLTLGRAATTAEVGRATAYLAECEAVERTLVASAGEGAETAIGHQLARNDMAEDETGNAKAPRGKSATKRPAPPLNPDEVPPVEEPVQEEVVRAPDARSTAWASFCQALLGSAEFRYVK